MMKFGLRATTVSGLPSRPSPAIRQAIRQWRLRRWNLPRLDARAGWWYGGWLLDPPVTRGGCNYDISGNASGIVTVGPDPIVGNLLNRVDNEIYAARVKDWVNNNSVSVISQTVNNYTDPRTYFAWAAVVEALHSPTHSGNFTLMLTDDTTHTVLYAVTSRNNSTADSAAAGTLAMVGTGLSSRPTGCVVA